MSKITPTDHQVSKGSSSDDEVLSEELSRLFFERACKIEEATELRWRHVREGAHSAGFSQAIVEQAEKETRQAAAARRKPEWVRLALVGVADRATAQFWYKLLSAAGLLMAALYFLRLPLVAPSRGLIASLWLFGCAFVHSHAIRWMDSCDAWDTVR